MDSQLLWVAYIILSWICGYLIARNNAHYSFSDIIGASLIFGLIIWPLLILFLSFISWFFGFDIEEYPIFVGIIIISLIYFFNRTDWIQQQEITSKDIKWTSNKNWEIELTEEFKEILYILENLKENIFITGEAWTGKSSLLKYFAKTTKKKFVVIAPTWVAALNASWQTIHSFFHFPANILKPETLKPDYVRAELFKNLEMLIIDEVSMVRSDIMDSIDKMLRLNRNRLDTPFWWVQIVLVGDLFQLPPVVTDEDKEYIYNTYWWPYFFDAPIFKNFTYQFKILTKKFRQSSEEKQFINLLNNIRNNCLSYDDLVLLNSRHKNNIWENDNWVFLTSKKIIAKNINQEKLENLSGQKYTYTAHLTGKYIQMKELSEDKLDEKFPAPYKLELKVWAKIMMLKNDSWKRWVNWTIGLIDKMDSDNIYVRINQQRYLVTKEVWKEVEYFHNPSTSKIEEKIIASFTQFPLQLAYAMTIHKSQWKTFDNITVDIGTWAFSHWQVYVALSRCTSLNWITLSNSINQKDIIVDTRVVEYYKNKTIPQTTFVKKSTNTPSKESIEDTIKNAIKSQKSVKILYVNYNWEQQERILSELDFTNKFDKDGYKNEHIKAFCHIRKEERSFKISRIKNIEIL